MTVSDTTSTTLSGIGVSPGLVAGPVARMAPPIPEPEIATLEPSRDIEKECERIALAAQRVKKGLELSAAEAKAEARTLLETTAQMAADPTLTSTAQAMVREKRLVPERAVWESAGTLAAMLESLGGYMAERTRDVQDVRDRIVAVLTESPMPGIPRLPEPFVLVATDLAPADTALLDPEKVIAFITSEGGPTSHTAILARALGMPAIVGTGEEVTDALTEGDIAHYTTDSASIQGSGTTVEGTITNTYAPRPTTHDPAVEKKIEGPKPSNPDTFSFVLKRTDASFPMPAGSDGDTKTITVEGAGSPEFGDIAFTLPGTYTYTITETKGGAACTYDGSSYALTYEVADDGQGKLRAKRSMTKTVDGTTTVVDLGAQGDAIGAVFTNVYPTPDIPTPTPNNPTSPDRPKATKVRKTVGTQALPQTGDGMSSPVGLLALSALVLASGSVVRWHKGQ